MQIDERWLYGVLGRHTLNKSAGRYLWLETIFTFISSDTTERAAECPRKKRQAANVSSGEFVIPASY